MRSHAMLLTCLGSTSKCNVAYMMRAFNVCVRKISRPVVDKLSELSVTRNYVKQASGSSFALQRSINRSGSKSLAVSSGELSV